MKPDSSIESPTPPQGIHAPNLDLHITQAKHLVAQFAQNLVRYGVPESEILHLVREACNEVKPA